MISRLDSLDQPVLCPGRSAQTLCQTVDALVMEGIDLQFQGREDLGKRRIRVHARPMPALVDGGLLPVAHVTGAL